MTWLFVALAASLGLGGNVRAQGEREVAGTVRHADTQAPLDGAIVVAGDRRAITDRSGRFTLRMPADVLVLEVTAAGFYPFITRIDRRDGDATNVEVTLIPASGFTDTVDVVAPPPLTAGPSATAVTPVEVLHTPGALDNVFRTLQTLPGVSATDEFGSRLAVRGGAPDQNLTMMDTVEIHDPYRLFGLTSAFNPETIQRFELATGGFSVKYGDRLSSLLVVENRAGTRQRPLAGSAALSITDANVVLEGRLPRNASGSWLISGRRTYYDLVASRVADQDFPSFADVQAKGVWDLAPGRTVSVFALRSRQNAALEIDDVDARGEFNDDTRNDLVSVRFDAGIGGAGQSHTIVAYSKSTSSFGVDAAFENRSQRSNAPDDESVGVANVIFDRTLALRDVSLRQELSWVRRTHVVEGGGELHRLSTNLTFAIEGDRNPAATNGSSQQGGAGLPDTLFSPREVTRGGLWVLDRWQATPGLSLEGGLRLDRGGVNGDLHLSPRVNATYALSTRMRARAAVGRYTQSPGYEKLVQSDYVLDLTGSTAARLRSEQAWQTSLGLERDFGRIATLRVEGYVKRFNQLLVGRLETDAERTSRLARYDFPEPLAAEIPTDAIITSTPTNEGRGRSYGLDVLLSRTDAPVDARVRGWISYTWGRATRLAYGRTYPFEYDRRHSFSAVTAYRLTGRWEVAATTRLASGFPRTPPIGLRIAGARDDTDRDGDGDVTELVPAFDAAGRRVYAVDFGGIANLNTARLPLFARVDLRVTWRPGRRRWELYGEVINLLDRRNAGALDPQLEYDPTSDRPAIVERRDQGIPRFPTVGIRYRF